MASIRDRSRVTRRSWVVAALLGLAVVLLPGFAVIVANVPPVSQS
jgi:hypothetical protein